MIINSQQDPNSKKEERKKENVRIANALIDMYGKCGEIESAKRVFQKVKEEKNVITWTAMMNAYLLCDLPHSAIELFYTLVESGIQPNLQ